MKKIFTVWFASAAIIVGAGFVAVSVLPATSHAADYGYSGSDSYGGDYGNPGTCSSCGGSYDFTNSGGSSGSSYTYTPQPKPECTLRVKPAKIEYGGSVTISWTTKHADKVTLTGFGEVAKKNTGKVVSNLKKDKTYVLTVKGNGRTVTCKDTVNVKPEPKPEPSCTLTASKSSISRGESSTLEWTTDNATSVSISSVGSVALDGTKSVSPTNTKTYTLTAKNGNKQVTCAKTITVTEDSEGPSCTLDIEPSTIEEGDDVVVHWTTDNADTVKLNGSTVSKNGSKEFDNITHDKEFELEVWGDNNEKVTCTEEVEVEEEDDNDNLSCDLYASKHNINPYEQVRLSWESDEARYASINQGIGSVPTNGARTVNPGYTTTYTATFTDRDGDTERCSVTVYVNNTPVYVPPYITLSSVPYTGLELGPVGTALYWSFLVLWCLVAAYLIAVKKAHYAIARRVKSFLFGSNEVEVETAQTIDMATLTAMVRAIVEGPQSTPRATPRASAPAAAVDATDEFVLSQIHRN